MCQQINGYPSEMTKGKLPVLIAYTAGGKTSSSGSRVISIMFKNGSVWIRWSMHIFLQTEIGKYNISLVHGYLNLSFNHHRLYFQQSIFLTLSFPLAGIGATILCQ